MAITQKEIAGTDSISSMRIIINDNTTTVKEALNNVLSIIDTSTGGINNSTYGSLNNITTKAITVTSGNVVLNTGNITLDNGNMTVTAGNITISAGRLSFLNVGLREQSTNGNPILGVTGASAFQFPSSGSTAGLTGATGGITFYNSTSGRLNYYDAIASTWREI